VLAASRLPLMWRKELKALLDRAILNDKMIMASLVNSGDKQGTWRLRTGYID